MGFDEFRAFAGAVFGMLQRAFPFDHGPAGEIIGGHLGEDGAEIDLATSPSERKRPARFTQP